MGTGTHCTPGSRTSPPRPQTQFQTRFSRRWLGWKTALGSSLSASSRLQSSASHCTHLWRQAGNCTAASREVARVPTAAFSRETVRLPLSILPGPDRSWKTGKGSPNILELYTTSSMPPHHISFTSGTQDPVGQDIQQLPVLSGSGPLVGNGDG